MPNPNEELKAIFRANDYIEVHNSTKDETAESMCLSTSTLPPLVSSIFQPRMKSKRQ